ncbi:MAG: hypothetical protein RH978_03285, partial [Roseitalea porphyridii]|uniref:hypothetical protein n=1 Tax=Roseitalea porphyridii TaxID=1852022 RepID=UPI0032EFD77A
GNGPGKWLVWRIGNPIGNIGLNPSPIEFKTPKCNEPRKTGVRQQSEPRECGVFYEARLILV